MPRRFPTDGQSRRVLASHVAELAGVSQSAVSRTFSGGSVSAHVRARVQAAARKLGYRPNAMAAAVITRRSNMIAILMTANINSHFPEVLSALSRAATAHGLRVMLFTVQGPDEVPAVVDQILSYQLDGVLSLTEVFAPDAAILEDHGVELVLYNRSSEDYPASLVSCDHRDSGRQLARHLLALGHRDFGLIKGHERSVLSIDRAGGVLDVLEEAGIPRAAVPTAAGDLGYDSGRAGAAALLAGPAAITALVCVNDVMAIGAIDEATSRGLKVPADLSVAGFDGIPAGTWDRYRLTTMRQPLPQLAEAAVDTITRKLADPARAHEKRLLLCTFAEGASTAPPGGAAAVASGR